MLDLIVRLIGATQGAQEELTESQVEVLRERLMRGEVRPAEAHLLLRQLAGRGDLAAVNDVMAYLAALGLDSASVLRVAVDFYFGRRHYAEAQRYAQTLCYEQDRYGPALRRLAMLDVLLGDYTPGLVHIEEYLERNRDDATLRSFQLDALLRSGAFVAATELNRQYGLRAGLEPFFEDRAAGRGLGRFSWLGAPSRKGDIYPGADVQTVQAFLTTVIKRPLQRPVPDLPTLDLIINQGVYIPDDVRYGQLEKWVEPAVFEMELVGDCEDFALWAWVNLCRMGYPARFVAGGLYGEEMNHAWVTIHRGRSVQVLECTPMGYNPLISSRNAFEYRPHWSIDRNLHCYRH